MLALAGALGAAALGPATIASAASPSTSQCEKAWYEWQYFSLAPGFPTTLSPKDRNRIVKQCKQAGRLPNYDAQVKLTQKAFNVTAQILEREIARVSLDQGLETCAAAQAVLKRFSSLSAPRDALYSRVTTSRATRPTPSFRYSSTTGAMGHSGSSGAAAHRY